MDAREPVAAGDGRLRTAAPLALVLLTVIAYSGSFKVPFTFDDGWQILESPTVRDFGRMMGGLTRTNRPLALFLNWLNFALGGLNPFGYHLLNLAIHLANSLLVYLLLVATPMHPRTEGDAAHNKTGAAFVAALFFALHPVHTMAVTYIIQGRMVGTATLGVLLCLFLFQAAVTKERPWLLVLAFLAFLVGMGGKETAAAAPFLCLAYDRLFLAPKGYGLTRARLAFHGAGLMLFIAACVYFLGYHRADTVGFGARDSSPLGYLYTQFGVIVTYLRLLVFPAILKVHHQIADARGFFYPETLLPLMFLIALLGGFLWLGKRDRRFAFGIVWFFIALAPTSSFIPIIDRLFEHRLYLPSIGFSFILAAALQRLKLSRRAWAGVLVIPVLLGVRTFDRNLDWQHPLDMYLVEARLSPGHYRALTMAVDGLYGAGRYHEAVLYAKKLLKVMPDSPDALVLLGRVEYIRGNEGAARGYFVRALKKKRLREVAYSFLGYIERQKGNLDMARDYFLKAHKANRGYLWAVVALGKLAEKTGDREAAARWFGRGFNLFPDNLEVAGYTAAALERDGNLEAAARVREKSLDFHPHDLGTLSGLGVAYYRLGRFGDALPFFERAAKLNPEDPTTVENMANCLFAARKYKKAQPVYERLIALAPEKSGMARAFLGRCLLHQGRVEEGLARLKESCARKDGDPEACFELGMFHDHFKRFKEAARAYESFLARGGEPYRGYYNLGMLYLEKLGERAKGLDYLKKSLAAKPDQRLAPEIRERLSREEG